MSNIQEFYSSVDTNILNKLCKNTNLKNLINLSAQTDIYVFNKKYKKWQLKSKDILLKECNKVKKHELKLSATMLSNLAKLNNHTCITDIKMMNNKLENKLDNIEKIMTCINHLDDSTNLSDSIDDINTFKPTIVDLEPVSNKYIECYTN
jgi:hypothetical protein